MRLPALLNAKAVRQRGIFVSGDDRYRLPPQSSASRDRELGGERRRIRDRHVADRNPRAASYLRCPAEVGVLSDDGHGSVCPGEMLDALTTASMLRPRCSFLGRGVMDEMKPLT